MYRRILGQTSRDSWTVRRRRGRLAGGRGHRSRATRETELLNVACDPTRELWRDVNERFIDRLRAGARRPADDQDVARRLGEPGPGGHRRPGGRRGHAGLWSDTNAVRKRGLIDDGWDDAAADRALPYYSTIVFVVRKGNPKEIRDWPDLVKPGRRGHHPEPEDVGQRQASFLAAWGAELRRTGGRGRGPGVRDRDVPARPGPRLRGPRGDDDLRPEGIGDVHLTWENEAHLEVQEARGRAGDRLPDRRASGPSRPSPSSMPTSAARGPSPRPRRT